jgi:hypothetical protein
MLKATLEWRKEFGTGALQPAPPTAARHGGRGRASGPGPDGGSLPIENHPEAATAASP